jgi:hypothetical protein
MYSEQSIKKESTFTGPKKKTCGHSKMQLLQELVQSHGNEGQEALGLEHYRSISAMEQPHQSSLQKMRQKTT